MIKRSYCTLSNCKICNACSCAVTAARVRCLLVIGTAQLTATRVRGIPFSFCACAIDGNVPVPSRPLPNHASVWVRDYFPANLPPEFCRSCEQIMSFLSSSRYFCFSGTPATVAGHAVLTDLCLTTSNGENRMSLTYF